MEGDVNVDPSSAATGIEKVDQPKGDKIDQPTSSDPNIGISENEDSKDNEDNKDLIVDVDVDVNVNINTDDDDIPPTHSLKIGMSKREVFNILGRPVEVENVTYPYEEGTIWKWEDKDICVRNYPFKPRCHVEFDEYDEVEDWDEIKSEYIDLLD
jgi:hypothetical protein